jgi:uncharacterized protein (TIGR02145 family)
MKVCPSGWHLPTNEEWEVLTATVGGKETAGKYLKTVSGWYKNGNGTDTYGFSALPGGTGYSDGSFYDVGYDGDWWSASEYKSETYFEDIHYDISAKLWLSLDKSSLRSVRCLQD